MSRVAGRISDTVLARGHPGTDETATPPEVPAATTTGWPRRNVALGLGAAIGLASLARDAVLMAVFDFGITPDSYGYIAGIPIRTRPYPLVAALTGAAADPIYLIWLQIVLAAFAAGLIVFLIGGWSPLTAAMTGILLLADVFWAVNNRLIMTESLYTSLSLISLAMVVYQYERRRSLHPLWLLAAGLLYGWTLLIRPSNIFLGLVIVAAYLVFTRSGLRAALVAAGIAIVLLFTSLVTQAQTGHFRLNGGTGVYLAFPLFSYHLFSPTNGPSSAELDAGFKSCQTDLDYRALVAIDGGDLHIWSTFLPCLRERGWSEERISTAFTAAYLESLRTHPRAWARSVLDWTVIFVDHNQGGYVEEVTPTECTGYGWCEAWSRRVSSPPYETGVAAVWERSTVSQAGGWRQAYLFPRALLPPTQSLMTTAHHGPLPNTVVAATFLLWLAIGVFLWLRTRGSIRLIVMASIVVIWYTAVTVAATGAFLTRYSDVLGPFFCILSAVLLVALLRFLAFGLFRARRQLALAAGRLLPATAAAVFTAAVLYVLLPPLLWQQPLQARLPLRGPFTHLQGDAYAAAVIGVENTGSDTLDQPERSTLTVYEDGRRLGPPHSLHASIFEQGEGRFSHWTSGLFFSTSDNSDPNLNGRTYSVGYDRIAPNLTFMPYLLVGALIVMPVALLAGLRRRVAMAFGDPVPTGSGLELEDAGV